MTTRREIRAVAAVLTDVLEERLRQNQKWGEQNHPDGTGHRVPVVGRLSFAAEAAADARLDCQTAAAKGTLTWRHIIREELYEAIAEDDPAKLRNELVQVAAVAVQWIEAIDRRKSERQTEEA